MKKTHRTLLSILLALTLLASLPMTALAEETVNSDNHVTLKQDYDKNTGDNVTVDTDVTVGTNTGDNVTNNGTINTNEGTVKTNDSTITNNGTEDGGTDSGTVDTNNGKIENNYGTVETNAGGGYILENYGNITTNEEGATVSGNCGTIEENSGCVGSNSSTQAESNDPAVVNNNSGTVEWNDGVVNNIEGGKAWFNQESGVVNNNAGGEVFMNLGQVNNKDGGVVEWNLETGTVNNASGGEVKINAGIVHNEEGGLLNNAIGTKIPDGENSFTPEFKYEQFKGEQGTYVGTELEVGRIETTDKTTGAKTYNDFEDGGITNVFWQAIQGTTLNLKELGKLFRKDDYEVIGYQAIAYRTEIEKPVVYETEYKVTNPGYWLNLLWQKIVRKPVASPAGDEAVPTSYDPNYIGLGSVIFINEKGYKVVEIKDDAYVVVTFDALPDEDVADLNALFDKLFTPEQQKLIKNIGQLLDSEDVLTIFGKPGNHPVFEFQKDLVK